MAGPRVAGLLTRLRVQGQHIRMQLYDHKVLVEICVAAVASGCMAMAALQ